jgi:two-component system chemotaxis response regulator CheB
MPNRDVITIGGSAGSMQAIKEIARTLPADLAAAVFIVIHLVPRARSYLPEVLQKDAEMLVVAASDLAPVRNGTIYVAPPDRHLFLSGDHIHLSRGPKEGLHRPSINVTLRSAAAAYGNRVIGVLLSGMLDDGAAGIWEIGRRGGVTIVQDPSEAEFPSMPLNALNDAIVHHTAKAARIAPLLVRLVQEEIPASPGREEASEGEMAQFSGYTCPECRGPLYETDHPTEFRCRVGHVLSLKTLFDEHTSTQERKLYEAMVALEEGADLADRMALSGNGVEQGELRKEAAQLRKSVEKIREIIESRIEPAAD